MSGAPAWMEIDLGAVAANVEELRRRLGPRRKLIATLKADAYGHGGVEIARRAVRAGADILAVGGLAEAAAIRAAGVTAPMILLGALLPEMIDETLRLDLIPSLDERESARALARAAGRRTPVFVKIDGGFGRFGVAPADAASFLRELRATPALDVLGAYTHIPFSDAAGRDWAARRLRDFADLIATLTREGLRPPIVQALASPGLCCGLRDEFDAAAIGHLIFGLHPAPILADSPGEFPYRPALRAVRTGLLRVAMRRDEDRASYLPEAGGGVGVIAMGILHGYRPVSAQAFVIVGGAKAPVLRACLENTVVDLSRAGDVAAGAEVTVLGAEGDLRIGLEEIAAWHATSPLAWLTTLGRSVARRYVAA